MIKFLLEFILLHLMLEETALKLHNQNNKRNKTK